MASTTESAMEPIELIIAVFEKSKDEADEMLKEIQQLAEQEALELKAAAVIAKTQENKIEVRNLGDVQSKEGRLFGAVSGAVIGLLGGPLGALVGAAAGAVTGGIAADKIDLGVPNDLVKEVRDSLRPGSSALILYAKLEWVEWVVDSLLMLGATVRHETLEADVLDSFLRRMAKQ